MIINMPDEQRIMDIEKTLGYKGGKNLINSNIKAGFIRCTGAYENGSVTFVRNATKGVSYYYRDYILEKGVTYTISANCDVDGYLACMYVSDEEYTQFSLFTTSDSGTGKLSLTFTPTEDFYGIRVLFTMSGASAESGIEITFTEMQLERGTNATGYQPYAKSIDERLAGCWFSFTDEDGNPTDEPYIHWLEEVSE